MRNPCFIVSILIVSLGAQSGALSQNLRPDVVTIAGDLQSEVGCEGDWQPECATTQMMRGSNDDIWRIALTVPPGDWFYKAPVNGSWDENYGLNAVLNGDNIPLSLPGETIVRFYYSHESHWVTDNVNSVIAVGAGDFQSEMGCANDWDPGCMRSWLQDPDEDGIYRFVTSSLPEGSYEVKVALNESWDENYGQNGEPGGDNIPFTVLDACRPVEFVYDSVTHELQVGPAPTPDEPAMVTVAGSLQSELGCDGDWQPDCSATQLTYDAVDGVWQQAFNVPAGSWEYKAPLNGSWDENYGAGAQPGGANIGLDLAADEAIGFYYSHATHWITDSHNSRIAVAPGNFQAALGCSNDWDPGCLRSWLQDPDGDGLYRLTARLPAGSYETKVAINESWDENYGEGGIPNGANIAFSVDQACSEAFFAFNSATNELTVSAALEGPKGDLGKSQAYWLDATTVAWRPAGSAARVFLHHDAAAQLQLDAAGVDGGTTMELTENGVVDGDLAQRYPHLAGQPTYAIVGADAQSLREALRGQVAVSAVDADGNPVDATGVQIAGALDALFAYGGTLGPTYDQSGQPGIAVWAPTAQDVRLHLFADSGSATAADILPMTRDTQTGVWTIQGTADWDRRYYLFEVSVYAPSTRSIETNLVTDPYSLSLATDSARSQLVNLSDRDLMPRRWRRSRKPVFTTPEDMVLYELHVRDFSILDATVPASERGTFRAFTQSNSAGMQHLRSLADAGVSHVHLLPAFDIATVPEDRSTRQEVDRAYLSQLPSDSSEQQEAVAEVRDLDGFNWGYDPWHYSTPEGSYSTDPDGVSRILEFREMVQNLNRHGLRVVMDVVYNHTTAAGQNARSVLDRIVPGYYHRLNGDGAIEMSSCCPNTATEHRMMEKLMVDSVLTWARDYKIDGFRFDLMGHHSKENMLRLRAELDALTPHEDGVNGADIYLYGEGWNFGEVANNARFVQATQANMAGTGIGTFSDRMRDGARGGNPFSDLREQGFINGLGHDPSPFTMGFGDTTQALLQRADWIRIGMAGDLATYAFTNSAGQSVEARDIDYLGQPAGYTADPQENISYVAAHDNETLFDSSQLKLPQSTGMADRIRVQSLGSALVLLGQGVPFIHAGQEFLRSKSMDRDSFNSGDWFNAIDWSLADVNWAHGLPVAEKNEDNWSIMAPLLADPNLAPNQQDAVLSADRFRELLKIRSSIRLLRLRTGEQVHDMLRYHNTGPQQLPGVVVSSLRDEGGSLDRRNALVVVAINARATAASLSIPELANQDLVLHPVLAQSADPQMRDAQYESSGGFSLPGRSASVFVAPRTPDALIQWLLDDVDDLVDSGALSASRARPFKQILNAAARLVSHGPAARAVLLAFEQHVRYAVHRGYLNVEAGDGLRMHSADARTVLR